MALALAAGVHSRDLGGRATTGELGAAVLQGSKPDFGAHPGAHPGLIPGLIFSTIKA